MTRTLLLLIALFFSSSSLSFDLSEKKLLMLYHESIENVSNKEKQCSNQSRVLDSDIFTFYNLSKENIKIILKYKNVNAFLKCTKDARYNYYRISSLLRLVSVKSANMLDVSDNLITAHDLSEIKFRLAYEKALPMIRTEIDKIKDLDIPFNLIETYENILLSNDVN